jgi:putative acetyltransferase
MAGPGPQLRFIPFAYEHGMFFEEVGALRVTLDTHRAWQGRCFMEFPSRSHFDWLDHTGSRLLMQRLRLTPLTQSDEAEIVDMIEKALLNLDDAGPALISTRQRLSGFFTSYQETGSSYLVLREGLTGRLIGGIGVRPFAGLAPEERLGEIRELVIDPHYRSLGLGRNLLEAAIHKANKLSYRRLYLQVTSQMQHARLLFERSGFRPVASTLVHGAREGQPSYFVLGEEP